MSLKSVLSVAALGVAVIAAGPGVAQQGKPEAVPEKMPFDIPYGAAISIAQAKEAVAAAVAEARKHGWKFNIAVVDPSGDLVYFERMDGAQVASGAISQGKARTAARFRRPSVLFFNAMESGHNYVATLDPTLIASAGGNPLVVGGKLIGAIGVSGGTGSQDDVVSMAGAAVVNR
ncbi:MAG: heme-binding protein [Betaproteobacteria bacterium]